MNADEDSPSKKKAEKSSTDNLTVTVDKVESKRLEKGDEEPKPRIVLTFRSEKNSAKNSNMKIVSSEEKHEEAPRRSSRTRRQWEWICDSDTSPKKDKSGTQTTSENDESDSSHTTPKRSTRRRSKDADNVLANAIARKEKSYETQPAPQRLSRRIKPTAKILANEELRIGLESQNNARLGLQTDKSPEEGVRTRRSARPVVAEEKKIAPEVIDDDVVEIGTTDDDSQSQNTVMKLKHLCELGLKAISPDDAEESENEHRVEEDEEENDIEGLDEDDEIDDDPNVISKLLETDEDSDEEFQCSVEVKKNRPRPRRSTRLNSSYGMDDSDNSSPVPEEEHKSRRSKKRRAKPPPGALFDHQEENFNYRPKRIRNRSLNNEEIQSDGEMEETSNPAGGDEGSEAACPVDESTIIATCFCEAPSNVYAAPEELTEPIFCQAVEIVDGIRVGCSHRARREPTNDDKAGALAAMVRAGPRAPYFLACVQHAAQLAKHMCCPACGLFCSQGAFYQCSSGHLFHLDCGLPYNDVKAKPGCPHCGVYSYRWQPANTDCAKVKVEMKCSNKRIFLPDQREQCFPNGDDDAKLIVDGSSICPNDYNHLFCDNNKLIAVRFVETNKEIYVNDSKHWPLRVALCRDKSAVGIPIEATFRINPFKNSTPAYLSFSTQDLKLEQGPIIPKELLPSPPIKLTQLGQNPAKSPTHLCEAILNGEPVDQLLPKLVSSSHINKPLPSESGGTCAHAAARAGHAAAMYLLHYAGANIDAVDSNTRTPLLVAITTLLEKPDQEGDETLKDTVKKEPEIMEVDPDKESSASNVKTEKDGDETGKADDETLEGDDKTVKVDDKTENIKIDKAEDVRMKPKDEDLIKVIRYLLAAGCDINFPGQEGLTALHLCAKLGGPLAATVTSLLLGYSSTELDCRDQGGWTPLVWAAENDHTDVVKVLLEAGADALSTDNEGNSVAHWCALSGAAGALRLLLHAEAPAAQVLNARADTPLHIAARQGHYACVVILLARGARTDIENSAGELPVEACTAQCQSAVSLNMQMAIAVRGKLSRYKLLSSDISNGREPFPIPCVNEVDDAPLPDDFTYVTRHVTPQAIHLDTSIDTMQGCECKHGDCLSGDCSCCALGVRCWYTRGRLQANFPYHDPPMLFECNQTCGCNLRVCSNSVVSRATLAGSMAVRAQVFRAGAARGWGLRARQAVPRGACVGAYRGELLALARADCRPADHYMFALEVKQDLLEQCDDKTQLCIDAAQYGNAARFINHSCKPNLAPVRVFTETRDLRLPTVALFATTDIEIDDEFTFDYGDKFWAVKSKWMKCECGHAECRYPAKSTDETESS